jgi:hypothetical protein
MKKERRGEKRSHSGDDDDGSVDGVEGTGEGDRGEKKTAWA